MNELGWKLEERSARGIAKAVGQAIRQGVLAPGMKLPPIRAVAKQLDLSPATVNSAWTMLARSGAIRTDGRRGSTVADVYSGSVRYARALERHLMFEFDLSIGTPDLTLLPDLKRAFLNRTSDNPPGGYLDTHVVPELIERLRVQWPYEAQRFMIVDGAMDAMEIATRTHVRFGDRVIVEDPSFPLLLDGLEAAGAEVVGVKIDSEGMLAKPLAEALSRPTAAVYLQPRAQNPTGVSMSPDRAGQLADIIRATSAMVIEDDSAGAIASTPAISLGQWLPEKTIHVRSFSKSHGPDLRLAAMSGHADAVQQMTARRQLGQGWTSRLLQQILLHLLTDKPAIKKIAHARQAYRHRRETMVTALATRGVRVGGVDGLNIWVPVANETAALVHLASQGIGVAAGEPFTLSGNQGAHIRVTISCVTDAHENLATIIADAATAVQHTVGR